MSEGSSKKSRSQHGHVARTNLQKLEAKFFVNSPCLHAHLALPHVRSTAGLTEPPTSTAGY